ncbi:MAG TPA: PaaI family thioesterase [Candidatus Dormibacteraeota bacterium]|nr:PaaI family thioesterase [Candidatus Dormibacteraeota bacterium]
MLALSGLERMRRSVDFIAAPPPIYHLTGLAPVEAEAGRTAFTMPVTPWLQTPVPGLIPGGVIAFLADGPLGTAIMTTLPPLAYMSTSDISMSFLRPSTLDSGTLTGRAHVVHAGRSVALSEVTIEDSQGRQVAHGTSRGFVLKAPGAPPPSELAVDVEYTTPDPYLRPVTGAPTSLDDWDRMGGLEILRRCVDDLSYAPPLYHLTGLRPIEALEGRCSFVLPASAWLMPPAINLYGGAIAMLADAALSGAVMTIVAPAGSFVSLDLKVNFLRPVLPDGSLLTAVATLRHRGRTMAVATAELFNEDGKRIAMASSSALLLPDRGWGEITTAADREVSDPA